MTKAYVLLKCKNGAEDYVLSNLRALDSVVRARGVLGVYDIVAIVRAESEDALKDIVTKKIRKIPKITGTYTLITDDKSRLEKQIPGKDVLETYLSEAHILIDCETGREATVLSSLREIPEVVSADVLMQSRQIMCSIMAPTYDMITLIVIKKIRKIPYITGTTTLHSIGK
ncbi:MAG: Lrp/AsnC ligand binding domain-containing protein [Candidatus Nitrosotenuis sp.]